MSAASCERDLSLKYSIEQRERGVSRSCRWQVTHDKCHAQIRINFTSHRPHTELHLKETGVPITERSHQERGHALHLEGGGYGTHRRAIKEQNPGCPFRFFPVPAQLWAHHYSGTGLRP